jgi:membrane-bound serine protease (ClpP class)
MRQLAKFLLLILDELLVGSAVIFVLYYFGINLWVYVTIIIVMGALIIFMAYIFLPQLKKPVTGKEGMIGLTGEVVEPLNPRGKVRIKGELWDAESNQKVEKGERVIVEDLEGLCLRVKKSSR